MPQFGLPDKAMDFPSWATEATRDRISRHPTPGTSRADGRLVLPSDPLGRHIATRHACRIFSESLPRSLECQLSSTDVADSLSVAISGVAPIPPFVPAPGVTDAVDGTFLASQVGDGCNHHVAADAIPPGNDLAASVEYTVLLWSVPSDPPGTVRVDVHVSYLRVPTVGLLVGQEARFRSGVIATDGNGLVDYSGLMPLVLGNVALSAKATDVWDFSGSSVVLDVDVQGTPPDSPPPNYTRSESVYVELSARSPFEAHGWSGTTARGQNVYWRLKWRPSLPISASPGVEHEIVFFRGGIEVGRKKMEWPDDALPWGVNSQLGLAAVPGEVRNPPDDDGSVPFGFESRPTSDRWEWWNSHQVAPSFYDADPAGSVAIECRIHGLTIDRDELLEFRPSWRLRWFLDIINRRHILAPVASPDVNAFHINTLVKHGEAVFDPDATTLFSGPDFPGLWYTYAIVLVFGVEGLSLSVHLRFYHDLDPPPFWEPLPSPMATLVGIGPNNAGRVIGFVPEDDGRVQAASVYPVGTRSLDEHGLRDIPMRDILSVAGSWLPAIVPGRATLSELKNRGDEPPQQGPLGIDDMKRNMLLAHSDGVAHPIGTGGAYMVFGGTIYDSLGWLAAPGDNYLTVPVGVKAIRGVAQCDTGSSVYSGAVFFHINGSLPADGQPYAQEQPDSSNPLRQQAFLPPRTVVPGDTIQVRVVKQAVSFGTSQDRNWCYLEAILPEVLPISGLIAEYSDAIPDNGTVHYLGTVPAAASGFKLTSVLATILKTRSVLDDVILQVSVIRAATRAIEDLLINVLTVDADHWVSATSVAPALINPATETVYDGDLLIASVIDPGQGGEGLSISLDFTEPM